MMRGAAVATLAFLLAVPPAGARAADARGITYIAVGDSYSAGVGSAGCGALPTAGKTCPSTRERSAGLRNVDGGEVRGFVQLFAAWLATRTTGRVTFVGMIVSGSQVGGSPRPYPFGNALENPAQLPRLAAVVREARARDDLVVLSVQLGASDAIDAADTVLCEAEHRHCSGARTTTAIDGDIDAGTFAQGSKEFWRRVASVSPDLTIVLGIPEYGSVPSNAEYFGAPSAAVRTIARQIDAETQSLVATVPNAVYVSHIDSERWRASDFALDGVHPNAREHEVLFSEMQAAFTAAYPDLP